MKKVIWIVVVVLVVLFISGSCSAYNRMVTAEETVNTTWADVEAQYQRRSDLIPNLVNTVKGYAAHEQSTFTEVVEARAQAMSFKLDAADLTPEKLAEFQQAQQKVGSALGRLIAVAEQYPDLKANQNFLELQAQLEGTENRIAVARTRFNDATRQYNVTIRRFPANLIAGMFGFDQKAYFAAEEGAQTVPEVFFCGGGGGGGGGRRPPPPPPHRVMCRGRKWDFAGPPKASAVVRTLFCRKEVLIKISGIAVKIPDKFLYFCSLNYHG